MSFGLGLVVGGLVAERLLERLHGPPGARPAHRATVRGERRARPRILARREPERQPAKLFEPHPDRQRDAAFQKQVTREPRDGAFDERDVRFGNQRARRGGS